MQKYFIFVVILILMIGCTSKESGTEQELLDSLKSQEETDSIAVTKPEPIDEKTTKQTEKIAEKEVSEKEVIEKEVIEDEASLWSSYRSAKEAAKEAEKNYDYRELTRHLLEAAEFANALQRYDIEAWQYNNAGYALIEDFKEKTEYLSVMDALNKLELKSEIMEYRKETRSFMSIEKDLLTEASKHLAKAKEIDDKLESSSRTTIIANNILFVNDVLSFLNVDEK